MKAIRGKFFAKHIRTLFGEQRIEVDEGNFLFLGQSFQTGIDFRNLISLVGLSLVAVEAFIDRKQALEINLCFGRFLLNAGQSLVDAIDNAIGRQVM